LENETAYLYDAAGSRVGVEDGGVDTRFEYDDLGRLEAVVENYVSGGSVDEETNMRTEYTYNALGDRLSITDGRDKSTTYSYDNQEMRVQDGLGNTTTTRYDLWGRVDPWVPL
jgi:YD repeat-containing protein